MKITPIQEKQWKDKTFWEVTTVHEGQTIKASLWPPFASTLSVGQEVEVEGTLVQNDKGYWTIKGNPMGKRPDWAKRDPKAEEKRQENMKELQDRKSDSIAYFNSVNSAITLIGQLGYTQRDVREDDNGGALKNQIIFWRDWFLAQYKEWETKNKLGF